MSESGTGFGGWHLKMLGAAIVCAPCLIGMALPKKFMKQHSFYIISFAVACMMATVFLELLPELMHEAPGKVGNIRVHWVDGQEYAQMPKQTATFLCAILLLGLVFGGFMESFLHMISPHAHGHSHSHGHGHGDCGHDHQRETEMVHRCSHGHSHGHGEICNHDHGPKVAEDAGDNYGHNGFYVDENGVYTNIPKKNTEKAECGHGCEHDHSKHSKGKQDNDCEACGIGHEPGKCGDHVHPENVKVSIDLAKLEEGLPQKDAIQAGKSLFGLPTLVVLDLLARSIHHTIDGIVAGVQDTYSRAFWGVIMGLACHEIGHSLGGIGLYMNLGVGKARAVCLVTTTQIVTTFFGTFLGMLLTQWQTDAMLDIYMQPVAIGLMMYIAMVDLLPELGHMQATTKQKLFNIIVVGLAVFSVAGIGIIMPHSHGAGVGPPDYYTTQLAETGHTHDHDHGHSHGGGCCGDHTADMKFQAEQTIRLATVTLNVVKNLQHGKDKSLHKDINGKVQDYVEKLLRPVQGEEIAGHEVHQLFQTYSKKYDQNQKASGCESGKCGHHHHKNHKHGLRRRLMM